MKNKRILLAATSMMAPIDGTFLNEPEVVNKESFPAYTAPLVESPTRFAPAVRDGVKPQRNAPCRCGSGKKYKKCCL